MAQGAGRAARLTATALCTGKGGTGGAEWGGGRLAPAACTGLCAQGVLHGVAGTGWIGQGARTEQCARGGLRKRCARGPLHPSFLFFGDRSSWNRSPRGARGGGGAQRGAPQPSPCHPASWPARLRPHPSTHEGPATAPLIKRGWSQGRFLLMYHCQAGQTGPGSAAIGRPPQGFPVTQNIAAFLEQQPRRAGQNPCG